MIPNSNQGIVNKHSKPRRLSRLRALLFFAALFTFLCLGAATNADAQTFNLTTSVDPAGGGTVTPSTTYVYDQHLAVVATPNPGWVFVNWTGVGAGNLVNTTSASTTIINPTFTDTDIRANFVLIEYSLTVTVNSTPASAPGFVTKSPDKPTYHYGDVVTLTALDTYPSAGSIFKGWGGAASGSDPSIMVIMDGDKTVTANFNATYTFSINTAGTGAGRAAVTSGAGSNSALFPGGTAFGTYLYELGDAIPLTGTDNMPTADVTGSQFQKWSVEYGDAGGGFGDTSKNTSVTITGDLSITGNFIGKYMITSLARTGGSITPLGSTIKYHGESQAYTVSASTSYVNSDVLIDGVSQGPQPLYTFDSLSNNHSIIAVFQSGSEVFVGQAAGDEQIYTASVPPIVLMVMGRDHKLYYEAYNDASDLDGDGDLDVGYKPDIDYYGYFDSHKVYKYDGTNNRFYPVRTTVDKKVNPLATDEWSGDFLNYLTMSRMDCLRKVLYGGYRYVDSATETVLMRSYIPQDAHSWGKEYESVAHDGYDITEYTPLDLPTQTVRRVRHLFANTTLEDGTTNLPDLDRPLLRVLTDSSYRIWEWVSIERPVAGTQCATGNNVRANCATAGGSGGFHPGHPESAAAFQDLVEDYTINFPALDPVNYPPGGYGSESVTQISGSGNPFGSDDNYLTLFSGTVHVTNAATYQFAVDGDDAVEVLVNNVVRAGWYGGHGACNCKSHYGSPVYLSTGNHSLEFRHEEAGGGDSYYLYWRKQNADLSWGAWSLTPVSATQTTYKLLTPSTPPSVMTDYEVKVLVCDSSLTESNSKRYGSGVSAVYKPTGILQKFGETGKMYFGLMTGSYARNTAGGVLRKTIGTITDEIDATTGRFKYIYDSSVNGIIKTIDKLRVTGFTYSDYSYNETCGWITGGPIADPPGSPAQCRMWGNPIAEMMYEGMRYFAGEEAPTASFDYTTGDDVNLGIPKATWDDPYVTNSYCAKPFMLVLSDINPSYDSNQIPGVNTNFSSGFTGTLSSSDTTPVPLNVEDVANDISAEETITGNHYIGQLNATKDGSCSAKSLTGNGFGDIRGLCPEEPTKLGSYYSASVAYFGRTHDVSPATGTQNVLTYVVGLASPLPRIEIPVGTGTVTLVPFAKTVGNEADDHGVPWTTFQPTNTIVDFYVEVLTATSGSFRINFEDVEQGADHDMDAIVLYHYQVLDDSNNPVSNPADGTKVQISLVSEYAAGSYIQHIGYILSGTTADGTYLEVRDTDTEEYKDNDVDYFLDTPPGVTPGGTGWDDNAALPLSATRIFDRGTTTAATLLDSPLWYAAKWGGFVDQNDNNIPDLQSEWDGNGDGVPDTYFYVVNPLKLEQQLTRTFSDILSRGVSHVAPVVSVDEANRTQSGDKLYMAFFKPMSDNYWQGNLKKYGLDWLTRTDCSRTVPEWTVVDASGNVAGYCDGTFKPGSQSFWSSEADGGYVDKGGVGARLKAVMSGSDPKIPAAPYYSFRNIYTYKGALDGSLVPFLHANITNSDLEVIDDLTRYRIINFMYGYTYDATSDADSTPLAKRDWILGDIIHSEPKVIDYFDDSGTLTHRFIAIGANDGMLHVFTDATVTIGGNTYQAGDEIFAFIPRDLLRRLDEFSSADTHIYTVDGSPGLYRSNTKTDGTNYDKTLIFGERSGGRSYWALDVSKPNPADWKVKWHIEGGTGGTPGFEELGYTWSKPFFTELKTSATTTKEVVIFAGGYDPIEDGFPEGFDDQNKNGQWDTTELHGVTIGGYEGYDKWNPGMDTMGRGIFVMDIADGSILFKATYGDDDGDQNEAEDVTTGIDQKYAMMKYCFPADISVIPLDESRIIMYAADVYGQIWRIRYDFFAGSGKWTVKRIFTANPGSTMASGDATAFTNGPQTLNTADAGRKMFYSPDVSLFGNDWTSSSVLYVGTGDRQHARYTMISNRMYFVSDTGTLADETNLLNLTCNELDDDATVDPDTKIALRNILEGGTNGVRGSYRVLDQQGNCADDDLDHTGEHILSQPTVFGGEIEGKFVPIVYFTSYQPVFDDPCNPVGNAFIYALNASFGTSALNYDETNDTTETDVRTLKDTYRVISGSSIPSGVRVIMRDGHAAGLISAGGAVAGVGEDGSTNIPGPPGGISPLLWETE